MIKVNKLENGKFEVYSDIGAGPIGKIIVDTEEEVSYINEVIKESD